MNMEEIRQQIRSLMVQQRPSEEWMTAAELAKVWDCTAWTAKFRAEAACRDGVMESKRFRVPSAANRMCEQVCFRLVTKPASVTRKAGRRRR